MDCSIGRGNHYVEYGGFTYRTLDDADPEGSFDNDNYDCTTEFFPVPAGWHLAPNVVCWRA